MFYSIFYLPIWFQAVQGVSAVESGIRNLPIILSMTVASMLVGILVTALGYYVPFMILGGVLMTIGMGLITTFTPQATKGVWIGYQVLVGFGIGAGMQQSMLAIQAVLSNTDLPIGTSLVIFSQTLGGAIGITIGQSIFGNQLVKDILKFAPGIDPASVVNLGASHLQRDIPAQFLNGVRLAYNNAITTGFYVGVAFAAVATVAACGMEWKSVKKDKTKEVEAGEIELETQDKQDDSAPPQYDVLDNIPIEEGVHEIGPIPAPDPPAHEVKIDDHEQFEPDISVHNIYEQPEDMVRGEFAGAVR